MAEPLFILIGSLARKGRAAADIDVVLPFESNIETLGLDRDLEFAGRGPRVWEGKKLDAYDLRAFEDLTAKAGKPIDIFPLMPSAGTHLAIIHSPDDGACLISLREFDGRDPGEPTLATFTEIVELAETAL